MTELHNTFQYRNADVLLLWQHFIWASNGYGHELIFRRRFLHPSTPCTFYLHPQMKRELTVCNDYEVRNRPSLASRATESRNTQHIYSFIFKAAATSLLLDRSKCYRISILTDAFKSKTINSLHWPKQEPAIKIYYYSTTQGDTKTEFINFIMIIITAVLYMSLKLVTYPDIFFCFSQDYLPSLRHTPPCTPPPLLECYQYS